MIREDSSESLLNILNGEGSAAATADPRPERKEVMRMIEWFPVIGYALILAYYVHHNVVH